LINGKRIAIVLPAYNAEKTLQATVHEIPDAVDTCILVDDHSTDATADLAHKLGLQVFVHDRNYGYGRNQRPVIAKRCRRTDWSSCCTPTISTRRCW